MSTHEHQRLPHRPHKDDGGVAGEKVGELATNATPREAREKMPAPPARWVTSLAAAAAPVFGPPTGGDFPSPRLGLRVPGVLAVLGSA